MPRPTPSSTASFAACTIIAHNYLPLARVLARSFLEHHPQARFFIAIVDKPAETRLLNDEICDVLTIADVDFGLEGFEDMATYYDVTEFATSVKPFVLGHLVQQFDCVLYLDPDIRVYSSLDPLVAATIETGWSLTPHCLAPIVRDGSGPTEAEIMAAGVYNLGYVGVTPRAIGFLDWWAERLRRDAIIDPSNQLFTDQRWVDLAVPIFAPHIDRSPTYNVAYWNVDQRNLTHDGSKYLVDGEPLRFFHFSGYDPEKPFWLSRYQPDRPRTLMSQSPVLARLCDEYADLLRESGHDPKNIAPYGWSQACPGVALDRRLRRMFRGEMIAFDRGKGERPPSPFRPGGVAQFVEWLRSIPEHHLGRLPRYLQILWEDRTDLRDAFPEVADGDHRGYFRWLRTSGLRENPTVSFLGWPSLDAAPAGLVADAGPGIDIIGYFQAELGVGEAGRLAEIALRAAGVSVGTVACRGTTSRQQHPYEASGASGHDTVLLAVNADQTARVMGDLGRRFFAGRYVIGQWFWEVEAFPPRAVPAFDLVDELWAPTEHIARALSVAPDHVALVHMPLPLLAPPVSAGMAKVDFGLPDRFLVLFSFDFLSVIERKNPDGLVEAFTRAFAPGEGPILLLKTINGTQKFRDLEELRWLTRGREDIVLHDGYLSREEKGALMNACDCYVSLHRAEGLGLTISEAMMLEKPVIATAYSGNMDFMTPATAHLVPWEPVSIPPSAAPYPQSGIWAEPDLDAAAAAMRSVVEDPRAADAMGRRARADLEARFSPEVTGRAMSERLSEIWSFHHA